MTIFWSAAIAVFLAIEGVTAGLASIWFAIGSAAALAAALLGAPLWLQLLLFAAVSGVTLYFTRPLAKKYVNAKAVPTNSDRLIGMTGVVSERIDNLEGSGLVAIDGKTWTARSSNGCVIETGTRVTALEISGAKLIVEAVREHETV